MRLSSVKGFLSFLFYFILGVQGGGGACRCWAFGIIITANLSPCRRSHFYYERTENS